MMTSTVWQFAIPIILLIYAAKLYFGKPGKNDSFCFPTRRARESDEIWDFVQRCAGVACFVAAIIIAVTGYVLLIVFKGNMTAYWAQIIIEIVCVVGMASVVNAITDKKFPPKKGKKK